MMEMLLHHAREFLPQVMGTMLFFALLALCIAAVRAFGWKQPLEPVEGILHLVHPPRTSLGRDGGVNVQFRDADDKLLDLGTLIHAEMHNGHGSSVVLQNGVFMGANPEWIKAGSHVQVSIQSGVFRESLVVQVDIPKQFLFVQSAMRLHDIVRTINGVGGVSQRMV